MHNEKGEQAEKGSRPVPRRMTKEEIESFRRAQNGCRESLNRLMARHRNLAIAVVRKQHSGRLDFAEIMQAGQEGLWRAIMKYDPRRGAAFSTYAWVCISRSVWELTGQEEARHHREEKALAALSRSPEEGNPARRYEEVAVEKALGGLVAQLASPWREVIEGYYGLNGEAVRNYRQLGEEMGVCRERIRQLRREAEAQMAQPLFSAGLRSLLERHTPADYAYAQKLIQRQQRRRNGHYGR